MFILKEKQKDAVNFAILGFVLLFITYLTKSACFSDSYFYSRCYIEKRKGWKISNIKGDYQNGGIQWKEEGFKLLLLILVENSRLPMRGKNRKTKQMFNCTGEDTFTLAPTMFYKL